LVWFPSVLWAYSLEISCFSLLDVIRECIYPKRCLQYDQGHMVYDSDAKAAHEASLERDAAALARLLNKSSIQTQGSDQ
jgi:hypothetical protein